MSGINYSVDPTSRIVVVPLTGGGVSSVATFTINVNTDNTKTGNIRFTATLVRLENAQSGINPTNPMTKDATLSIAAPTPTPTPNPTPAPTPQPPGGGSCPNTSSQFISWCTDFNWGTCFCDGTIEKSPIIIDVNGDGFALTDLEHGINFDLDADGIISERVSWTAPNSDDAFLFLDRNEDGVVNNGVELFGNMTPQHYAPVPNGFVALDMYDTAVHGGNGDGVIDAWDDVYSQLRLWQDKNHNGRSEPSELHTLPELGVASISLGYKESKRTDQYGNRFRFRAKVKDVHGAQLGRWAWDVFLLSQ